MSINENKSCTFRYECDYCFPEKCYCKMIFDENYKTMIGKCIKCSGLGESCLSANCCSDNYLECVNDVCQCRHAYEGSVTCGYYGAQTPMYVTASQIALSAALIMGMAALTMVVYRLCTKPRYLSARQRALASQMGLNIENESLSYANYFRASLTSMQIRILTQLRDRPPSYDSRPTPVTLPEAPPPYEEPTEGISLPPPYAELVLSPGAYINSSFVEGPGSDPIRRFSDADGVSNRNIRSVILNCDTNQSIDNSCDKDKVTEESENDKTETTNETRIPL